MFDERTMVICLDIGSREVGGACGKCLGESLVRLGMGVGSAGIGVGGDCCVMFCGPSG
jgi:hypothetical protein